MTTTLIRNADWAILWDEAEGRQVYGRGIDLAFEGGRIVFIGSGYEGPVDTVFDGTGRLLMPGLVDVHSHLLSENLGRGITEEIGNPALYMSAVADPKPVFLPGHSMDSGTAAAGAMRAATRMAVFELLSSGTTTVADLAICYDGWLDTLAETGIRAVAAPMYRSAAWAARTGHAVDYAWDEAAGRRAFEAAVAAMEAAVVHPSGRISAMVSPAQVDTCSAELLRDSLALAEERDWPLTLHTAQSVWDMLEMTRRHGKTPVQWLADIGLLTSRTILGHAIFLDHHSWISWHTKRDLSLIAESGASVAHCPLVFSRYGQMLESFGRYRRAGINMALGTDTQPHNMLEEMRLAATLSRIAGRHVDDTSLGEVFHAATAGGAAALGRDDIGRLALGARADVVTVDLEHPAMRPARDPLRSLVYSAADRAVRDVFVGGRQVVRDGAVLTIDAAEAARRLEEAQRESLQTAASRDRLGRDAEMLSPLSLPVSG
ncbi:MAG: amidohydrolase family protein [Kiloniellaceae bacterium]